MKIGVVRVTPWLEARREFFVAQQPQFLDGEFRTPPYGTLLSSDRGAVYVARRLGYVGVLSKMFGHESIVVQDAAWFRFLHGLRERQFDGTRMCAYEVQVALIDGEIAVRMRPSPCCKERGVLTFSQRGWDEFLEAAKEQGTFYDTCG